MNRGETAGTLSYSFGTDRSHARMDAASKTETEHYLEIFKGFQDYNIL